MSASCSPARGCNGIPWLPVSFSIFNISCQWRDALLWPLPRPFSIYTGLHSQLLIRPPKELLLRQEQSVYNLNHLQPHFPFPFVLNTCRFWVLRSAYVWDYGILTDTQCTFSMSTCVSSYSRHSDNSLNELYQVHQLLHEESHHAPNAE